jgi:hypothetical protein
MNDVSCSNCGQDFKVPDDRQSGFSHCAHHNLAKISHTMLLELDDCDKLEATYLDDELHFAIVTQEGLEPITASSVIDAVTYAFPALSLSKRYAMATKIQRSMSFWLQEHELNNRKKQFTLQR